MEKLDEIIKDLPIVYDDEERQEDGTIRCKKCGGLRTVEVEGKCYRCLCTCQEQERVKTELLRKEKAKQDFYSDLCKNSLMGKRYEQVTFDGTDTATASESFITAYNRCKKYCDSAKLVKSNGFGIYLYGSRGVGKTHLSACMANELLHKLFPVCFTNFFEIQRDLRACFGTKNKETAIVDRLATVDFLFIDDIGTERVMTADGADLWTQEKMYDIINRRYNEKLPTIFTSNYGLKELSSVRGVARKTIDRIYEMTCGADIKIDGENYRLSGKKPQLPF